MYQIDNNTAAAAQPASTPVGTPGFFTDGNPATNVPATVVTAEWLNSVQQELINAVLGAGITPDKTKFNQLAAAMAGRFVGMQRFVASGTYTPTPGTTRIIVEVQGGGGGGGGVPITTATQFSIGGGGASGAYAKSFLTNGFSGGIAVTIGAGGAGAAGGVAGTGATGGTSSFGALISCAGGLGGISYAAATANGNFLIGQTSGQPAIATGGNACNAAGNNASIGVGTASGAQVAGTGNSSPFGGGGRGPVGGTSAGGNATSFGSGGGGASANSNNAAGLPGGNGAPGVVFIWEYA